jgi:hypothetical protein
MHVCLTRSVLVCVHVNKQIYVKYVRNRMYVYKSQLSGPICLSVLGPEEGAHLCKHSMGSHANAI